MLICCSTFQTASFYGRVCACVLQISDTTVSQKWCLTLSFLSERSFALPNRRHSSLEHRKFKSSGDSTLCFGKPLCLRPARSLKPLLFAASATLASRFHLTAPISCILLPVPGSSLTVVSSRGPNVGSENLNLFQWLDCKHHTGHKYLLLILVRW